MPVGFQLGPVFIRYYGIILMLGAVAGGWLAAREARRRGHDPEIVWDLLIWLIIGGVIGARLWHVFTPSPSAIAEGRTTLFYLTHPFDLINLRSGGLGIPGAVIGGVVALVFYCPQAWIEFRGVDRYRRAQPGVGTGDWPLGKFCEPGTVWRSDRPAVENLYRSLASSVRI